MGGGINKMAKREGSIVVNQHFLLVDVYGVRSKMLPSY